MRETIPQFDIPQFKGQRYTAMVPDTLELQDRAQWCMEGMTAVADPEADYEIYWFVYLMHKPTMMKHDWSDQVQIKFLEAMPLLRMITGSVHNLHVERRWMQALLHEIGPDGLAYFPSQGRPWAKAGAPMGFGDGDQSICPFYNGRAVSVMTLFAHRDPNGPWGEACNKLINGMDELAVKRDGMAWYWPGVFLAVHDVPADAPMPIQRHNCELRTAPLGLMHAYRSTGNKQALKLAEQLNKYLRDNFFSPDGTYIENQEAMLEWVHFHAHSASLLAMLEHAIETGNDEELDFVVKGYEYGKQVGEPLSGYFPEFIHATQYHTSEICEVADMVALAIKLAEAGHDAYWDDADRWTRNMFAEGQLLHVDWIKRMPDAVGQAFDSAYDPESQTVERVAERNRGTFAGWPSMNDWYTGHGPGIMHCCTGNAARTIYQAWKAILDYGDGKLKVNLLLNRASPWADLSSYIPFEGQVDVRIKQDLDLAIRIPEWAQPDQVNGTVNEQPRNLQFAGRYAQFGKVVGGDVVQMTFPIFEREDTVDVMRQKYTLVRKGNEVVAIDPPGRYAPLYQRAHYRSNQVRWREIERFVSDEPLHW